MRVKSDHKLPNVGSFVVRLFDADEILPTKRYVQTDIGGHILTDRISLFLENTVFAIDPATEYLYYEARMQRFLKDGRTPQIIRDYAANMVNQKRFLESTQYEKLKVRSHRDFWETAIGSPNARNKFIREIFQFATLVGADFFIPPVPVILDESFLDMTVKMNDVSRELALALGRKECANHFILPKSGLKNTRLLDEIKQYVIESGSRLNVFKFKNLDLTSPRMLTERENYTELLLDLSYITKTFKNRAFMVLENYYQSFASAVAGFDIVSSSITGFDGDGGFSEHPAFGSWLDPKLMVHVNFDDVRRMFQNNGGRLPCHHDVCKNITDIDSISPEAWNMLRRQHCTLYYDDLMGQITKAVSDRNVDLARERLGNSQLSSLRGLISIR